MDATSTLWKQLWDHDPNGLLVLDEHLRIVLVNPALCRMLKVERDDALVGRAAEEILGEVSEFRQALDSGQKGGVVEREYARYHLFVRTLIFPIPAERIVAAIFVDLTVEWEQERERDRFKQNAIQEVRQVVDKQMRVAQEIAGLLGEATAETKVSLLHLLKMLDDEQV
jgi:PAS domain-containing protein